MVSIKSVLAVVVLGLGVFSMRASAQTAAEQILDRYVADFRHDQAAAEPITFGVRVSGEGGGDWHVVVGGKKSSDGKGYDVTLHKGFPADPCVYYTVDVKTLRDLDAGKLNALTAMAKAFSSDVTPMDIELVDGFSPPSADFFTMKFVPLTFHFWTRGTPEIVPFGSSMTRPVHGGHASILFYQKGLRSAWVEVRKGDHVNADPRMQANPFPSMLIGISGRCEAKIDGETVVLEAGHMLFIPPNVKHEFWNEHDEPAQAILLMFGDGA